MKAARHLPRFQRAYRALDELAAREAWRREEIEAWQLERLNSLWSTATRATPYYAALKRERDLPDRFSTLAEFARTVPVLRKPLVRQYREQFLVPEPGRGIWKTTSGSTGICTAVFWPHEATRQMLRAQYRHLAQWGVDFYDRCLMLWSDRLALKSGPQIRLLRGRRLLEDWLRNRLRLPVNDLDEGTIDRYLDRMAAFGPTHVYAFSSSAYVMARRALERGLTCEALRVVVLTAEPLAPHMRRAIEGGFGAPVAMEYGSVECGMLAAEWPDGTLRVRDDYALVETVPRPDGRFDVLVTPFSNAAFPLIRYEIGDVTDAPLRRPPRGFAIMRGLVGRSNDLLVSRSGSFINDSPVFVMFESCPAIRRYRLRQDGHGAVTGQIELDDPAECPDLRALERRLEHLLHGFPVRLDVVDRIAASAGGKHRWIVTDMMSPLWDPHAGLEH